MKVDRKKSEPEIPTASMADIAFLLIVFFMITSVFSVTRGLEFQLPKQDNAETPPDSQEEAIHVHVINGGGACIFEVDKQEMLLSDIQIYIEPKLARNPNKFVIIDPKKIELATTKIAAVASCGPTRDSALLTADATPE